MVSGWASWAVGAIGAKFYKSSNQPPTTQQTSDSSPDKKTPDREVLRPTPAVPVVASGTTSGPLKLAGNKPEASSDLMDLGNGGDGWGGEDDDGDAWESFEEGKTRDIKRI